MYKNKKSKPTQINKLLENAVAGLGIGERFRDLELLSLWTEACGAKLANRTFAHRIAYSEADAKRVMVIGVQSAPLAQELQFLKKQLLERIDKLTKEKFNKSINDIEFKMMEKTAQNQGQTALKQ